MDQDISFKPVFDDDNSLSTPDGQERPIEDGGTVSSWSRLFSRVIEKKDRTVNTICLFVIGTYLILMSIGFIIKLFGGASEAMAQLQQALLPVITGFAGWAFGKSQAKRRK